MSDPKKQENKTVQEQPKAQDPVDLATSIAQKFIEGLMPTMLKAAQPQQAAPAQRYAPKRAKRRCDVCGWILADASKQTCDEHEEAIIYPTKMPELGRWFEGIKISGVVFRSPDETTPIKVPKGAAGSLLKMLTDYERAEYEARNGKIRRRHSGTVSPNGTRANPVPPEAEIGWK